MTVGAKSRFWRRGAALRALIPVVIAALATILGGGLTPAVAQTMQLPEYYGLWLPESYFPEGFTISPYSKPTESNPLRSNGSQVIEYRIDAPGRDDKQEWLTVFIDAMVLHQSEEQAGLYIRHWNENTAKLTPVSGIAEEAFADADFVGDDGTLCRSYSTDSPGPDGEQVHLRKLLLRYVRFDRLNFAIRVNSHLVQGLRKSGNSTDWYTVADPLPCERHLEIAGVFAERIRAYTIDQDWIGNTGDSPGPESKSSSSTPLGDGYPVSSNSSAVSAVAIAGSAIAVGGIAGVGAWLILGQAGIGRREALDALGDLARGRLPSDGFDDWKAKYEALGWTYREENGVAVFDPPEGLGEQAAAAPPPRAVHRAGEVNPDTGEVWSEEDGGWVGRELYEKEQARAGEIAAIEARNRQAVAEWDAETQALDTAIAASARDRAARAAAEEAARTRIGDKLTRLYEEKGLSTDEIERLRREGDTGGLEDLYEDAIRERMAKTSTEAAAYAREARLYQAGELASRAVLAGAKAGMMVVAGPAGYIPAAVGSGVLRSAEEGAGAWVASGGDKARLGSALVSGFFAGAKDGVVGRFTSLPRTGTATKILLPAGADATETYVRTGDVTATMTTAVLSATGGAAGSAFDAAGHAIAREAGQAATGATLGAAGSWVNGGSLSEGAVNGLVDSGGGRGGQHMGALNTPMTHDEILMDLEHAAKVADARERIDTLKAAIAGGDEAAVKTALNDVLDHREAKLLMGGGDVDPALKQAFGDLTQEHRTQPVMEGTAEALNARTVTGPDGTEQPRFVVRDANGAERPVTGSDFSSGSASTDNKPGMDLDMYPKETIIDKTTGRPAKLGDIEGAVSESCTKLGIDPHAQEVNVTGMKGKEDWVMREGETPAQFTARIQRDQAANAAEGTSISEVATAKLNEATERHGAGAGSSAVAEHARIVIKDKGRLIDHLIAGDSKAQIPEVFRRQDPVSGETPLTILKKVADGTMKPGTGNAKFRAMTGMDITEATPKIASWAEPLGKWGGGSPGTATPPPSFTGPGAGANLQQTVASAIKDATDKKGGE